MKTIDNNTVGLALNKVHPSCLLMAGIITMTLAHLTFSIDTFAWIAMVPFLGYLKLTSGWKSRLFFVLALVFAWSVIVFKIISPPIPYLFVFLYSVPIALIHLPGYLIWSKFKDHKHATLLFPVIMSIAEWIQYSFTPLASWGVAAYTQSHSTLIMQLLSIFGLAGLSFLVYWVNISLTQFLFGKRTSYSNVIFPAIVLALVIIFGALRYDLSKSKGVDTLTVAAIGTNSKISGLPLTPRGENETHILEIFSRTKQAAQFGAEIAVWNEAAFYLEPNYEKVWIDSIRDLALNSKIVIFASYVMPLSESPFKFENKYLLINANGEVVDAYLKHQPVPGEPAIKGTKKIQSFEINNSNLGGAICYDYDFPYIAKAFGATNTDIVALPSSDWRGIDPLHTRMAAFRAVEQGHSIIRSTRFGLSAAINPYGEMIAQMSSFDKNSKIMIAQLPKKGVKTIYAFIGDFFVYVCFGYLLFFVINWFRRGKTRIM